MELSVTVTCPVLDSVTVFATLVVPVVWDGKVRLVGENVTTGVVAVTPMPVRATLCGEPVTLSEMVRVPARLPVAAGVKVTATVQVAPAATLVPQVLV